MTIRLADGTSTMGVANIGRRPTVNAGPESRLEVNLFDFSGDIYGTEITVALIAYIRPEVRFSGLDALKAQIAADAEEARRLLMMKDNGGVCIMPMLKRTRWPDYYRRIRHGFPILLFAPGGLRSRLEMWHHPANGPQRPWCDYTDVLASKYRVVAMDQRNAGQSKCAIRGDHGWHTYTADHLALMSHLGHQKFHVLGGCIGGSYCLKIAQLAPDRVASAVLQNPIGVHPEHTDYFPKSHLEWSAEQRAERPELDEAEIASFGQNMWGADFVFCVDRILSDIARCRRCCCRARIFHIRRQPATSWRGCCQAWKCCINGAGRSSWTNSGCE